MAESVEQLVGHTEVEQLVGHTGQLVGHTEQLAGSVLLFAVCAAIVEKPGLHIELPGWLLPWASGPVHHSHQQA